MFFLPLSLSLSPSLTIFFLSFSNQYFFSSIQNLFFSSQASETKAVHIGAIFNIIVERKISLSQKLLAIQKHTSARFFKTFWRKELLGNKLECFQIFTPESCYFSLSIVPTL
jgi:hypothetical protein